ncbi:cysteine desulfurase family protein [Antarcticirhabdus aurantiaca]|uniref:Aminotransferase class V-fold PLP-dependent enzyme n=1 Tax=Antarcticirhabdus aurantiaca TaxID=2606717 RepID=A0ACD4NW88_9HYPH|nr:aminotransferase class V-fold PLP-dependent enzyme [Antarcticirhabdus aurantiaca]WAJ31033.1 aminotransferase class V-fold PLP-dependent enzyme [Jeongeuplla avenae]
MTGSHGRIYLDHNATAPLLPEAREALLRALDLSANPSSVHREGRSARRLVEDARDAVGALAGVAAECVVFASGATEAAATCLGAEWLVGGETASVSRLAVLAGDHPATRLGGRFDPARVSVLPVGADGVVDLAALDVWLDSLGADEYGLVAVGLANGETGVVQPAAEITSRLAGRRALFVLDAAQAVGRIDCRLNSFGADALILSGHKLGAAQGVGAIVLRDESTRPVPLVRGGGQQKGRRGGTEPVALIASLGAAARVAAGAAAEIARQRSLRDDFESSLAASVPGTRVIGVDARERLPNTSFLHHPAIKSDTAQIALDLAGFAVSSGSACSSGKVSRSEALAAMAEAGLDVDPAIGALRISIGRATRQDDLDAFLSRYAALAGSGARAAA